MDWLDLLAVQGTLKSLLQHHSSKASILQRSAFFTVQLSHPYVTTGKTIALTRRAFVGKVMFLLLNMLSRLVITFLRRSKCLLISWLQSPSAVILEPKKKKVWHCFHMFSPGSHGQYLVPKICDYHSPMKGTRALWRNGWLQGCRRGSTRWLWNILRCYQKVWGPAACCPKGQ